MSKNPKILFLNPPGDKIFIRDYYCSKVSKAYYLPQPVDLLIQTSFFDEDKYELKVLDCIVDKNSKSKALGLIESYSPDYIIGLIGSVSLDFDVPFYEEVKNKIPSVKILVSGDAVLEDYENLFRSWKWMDVVIYNFFNDGAKSWIENNLESAKGIVYRNGDSFLKKEEKRNSVLELKTPKHKLFPLRKYRMPFANAQPIATILTNYACPYPCSFCIMSTLPFMSRSAKSIIEELITLKKLGYQYIYFSDQTFFQTKSVTKEVLNWMIEHDYGISWMCFSRVDVLGKSEIDLMKKAGCNLIMFGVEFADEDYLIKYKKNYSIAQIKETFKLTEEAGIKRLGTFLIGVPGQTKESILKTIELAKEINADYASFNVAVPRSNTSFRTEAIEAGIIDDSVKVMDQSGVEVTMGTGEISRLELQRLKQFAYRSFYLRPSYIMTRLFRVSNWIEFKMHIREGYFILKGVIRGSKK